MKKVYKSKTVWAALVIAIIGMAGPSPVLDWMKSNIDYTLAGLGLIFGGLRVVTKGKIDWGFTDGGNDILSQLPIGIKAPK